MNGPNETGELECKTQNETLNGTTENPVKIKGSLVLEISHFSKSQYQFLSLTLIQPGSPTCEPWR